MDYEYRVKFHEDGNFEVTSTFDYNESIPMNAEEIKDKVQYENYKRNKDAIDSSVGELRNESEGIPVGSGDARREQGVAQRDNSMGVRQSSDEGGVLGESRDDDGQLRIPFKYSLGRPMKGQGTGSSVPPTF